MGGGNERFIHGPGHLTKMAVVKSLINILLQRQKSYHLETWHVTLGTQDLQSLY